MTIDTNYLDADNDRPGYARPALLQAVQYINNLGVATGPGFGPGLVAHQGSSSFGLGTLGDHLTETYYASDAPWNCQPGLSTDQSAAMQAAFDFVKSVGGTLKFKPGTYLGRIDFSGAVTPIVFDAQGSVFRPFSSSQGEVFYAKNSSTYPTISGQFSGINVQFRNVNVSGRLLTAVSDTDAAGHCDYGVNFICASAKWYDSNFTYGKIAAYHGYYHQYGEFWSCLFGASVFANSTAGCLLDGNTASESSNENRFFGPKFFSNKNGLVLKGGIKNRIYTPTIQDGRSGGVAGIWLTSDLSGFGAEGTEIHGTYAEINAIPAITIGVSANTVINGVEFLNAGESITSTHCYNLTLRDINGYSTSTSIVLNHPAGNTDTASVKIEGGNLLPSYSGLTHAGPTRIDASSAGTRWSRKDGILRTQGQAGPSGIRLFNVDEVGSKSTARTVPTTLFSIELEPYSPQAYTDLQFELFLSSTNDSSTTSLTGNASRIQRWLISMSNTNGAPLCSAVLADAGTDVGVSTSTQAVGSISLSSAYSGFVCTFSVTYSGSGTTPANVPSVRMGYHVRGNGAGACIFKRL